MNVTLVGFTKKGARKDIPLQGPSVIIGRTPEADIQIPVSDVSRRHCQISVNGAKVLLKDLGSSNGTFVNDVKVAETSLRPGDRLRVGPFTFVIQIDGKPEKIPSAVPKAPAPPTPKPTVAGKPPAAAPAAKPGSEEFDLDDLDVDNLDLEDMSPIEDLDELVEIDSDELEELDESNLVDDDKSPKGKK